MLGDRHCYTIAVVGTAAATVAMNTCHSYLKNVPHYLPSSLKVMLLYFPASLGRAVHYLISGVMEKASDMAAAVVASTERLAAVVDEL